jgi:hypothetical protein
MEDRVYLKDFSSACMFPHTVPLLKFNFFLIEIFPLANLSSERLLRPILSPRFIEQRIHLRLPGGEASPSAVVPTVETTRCRNLSGRSLETLCVAANFH